MSAVLLSWWIADGGGRDQGGCWLYMRVVPEVVEGAFQFQRRRSYSKIIIRCCDSD